MRTDILINNIKSIGLKIGSNGAICDTKGYVYGYVTNDGYRSMDGRTTFDVSALSNVGYVEMDNVFNLIKASGETVPVRGYFTGMPDNRGMAEESYTIVEDEEPESDVPRAIPQSVSELRDVFHELYPKCDEQIYYNELSEKYTINLAMIGEENKFVTLDDKILIRYRENVERRLKACGFFGKRYPVDAVKKEALLIEMDKHSRNPFRDYVESLTWDGVSRLRTWFQDTFGATCNEALSREDEAKYLGDVAEAWFMGAIGRMYGAYRHEIVPVFIGIQGIGKGHALEYTAGRSEFYTMTMVDPTAQGGDAKFLDAVRGRVIVELGEATQFKGDSDKMKNFITQTYDQLRKPYKSMEEELPRHFILASSSNFDNIFTDSSGNRRFFPMYCNPDNQTRIFSTEDRSAGQYDVDMLWAEALHMFRSGHKAFIYGEAEKRAVVMQQYCTSENVNISVIQDTLDDPMNGYTKKGSLVNKDIIMRLVFGFTTKAQQLNKEANAAYKAWADNMPSGVWKKRENVSIDGSKPGRAYERILEPDEVGEPRAKFLMVPTAMDDMSDYEAMSLIRKMVRENNLSIGDDVPTLVIAGLKPEHKKLLLNKGFLFYNHASDTYSVGYYKEL